MVPTGIVVFSSKIGFNVRTELVLNPLGRALLRADLVPNLAVNRSHAVVGSVNRTDLGLCWQGRAFLSADLVPNLFLNRSTVVVVAGMVTLGRCSWLLLFSPTLGAVAAGSNTLGVGTAIAVSTRVGGENIFESCSIASFKTVPCCSNGVAG
jgi:hypothetical protein